LSSEEEALRRSSLEAEGVNWLDPFFRERPFKGEVQVRYTQHPVPGEISPSEEGIRIQFKEPIRAITPGQAAVVYKGEEVICGGWIR
ncbi:MAG TPA: tRNA 2-thiouridine(34) synthase MnmA, partial [Spirochaetales bacterium]|nr:tRNA 2-thiouridine(34) synthase MnmA [Spirochaetales bacterium]